MKYWMRPKMLKEIIKDDGQLMKSWGRKWSRGNKLVAQSKRKARWFSAGHNS